MEQSQDDQLPPEATGAAENTGEIDPAILSALNLTQADVEDRNAETLREQEHLGRLKKMGADYYINYKLYPDPYNDASSTVSGLIFGQDHVITKPDNIKLQRFELPDAHMYKVRSYAESATQRKNDPRILEYSLRRTRAFFEGFGNQAMTNGDWKTAVYAYDVASEDGILSDNATISRINEALKGDTTTRVEVAKFIQERVQRRASLDSSRLAESPTLTPVSPAAGSTS